MRILFVGDYSNLHSCLAGELVKRGHDVTVVSDGSGKMNQSTAVSLSRIPGKIGGGRYLLDCITKFRNFRGYDVVQIINPHFLKLKPGKIKIFFDYLKRNNRSIFLTLAGNDSVFVKACVDGELFRYSEFRVGREKTEFIRLFPEREAGWLSPEAMKFNRYVYREVDGAMSVLPEYHFAGEPLLGDRIQYTGIPIDLSALEYSRPDFEGPLTILVGMKSGMEYQKGTKRLYESCCSFAKKNGGCRVVTVKDLPLEKYLSEIRKSHIVVDQLYSYSPATNALQSIAMGRVVFSGAEPEFYNFIGEKELRPVGRLNPVDSPVEELLEQYVGDRNLLARKSAEGRLFVEKHNDCRLIAGKFESHWERVVCRR